MILPIRLYGDPILRAQTHRVAADSPEVHALIHDMTDTLRAAAGVGLAAPQVGRDLSMFIVDLSEVDDSWEEGPMTFINPQILWEGDAEEEFEEGCLSIPDLRAVVKRPERIRIRYLDQMFTPRELEVGDLLARVIQHEYDHLEGILFIDHISAFRRQRLKSRLHAISRGEVQPGYKVTLASD